MGVESDHVTLKYEAHQWVGTIDDLTDVLEQQVAAFDMDAYVQAAARYERVRLEEAVLRTAEAAEGLAAAIAERENRGEVGSSQRESEHSVAFLEESVKIRQERLDLARAEERQASEQLESEEAAIRKKVGLRAVLTAPGERLTKQGSPREIARWCADRRFDLLTFTVGPKYESGNSISFLLYRQHGPEIQVESADESWGRLHLGLMRTVVERRTPRSSWLIRAAPLAPWVGLMIVMVPANAFITMGATGVFAYVMLWLGLGTGAVRLGVLLRNKLPRVEIHTGRPRSTAVSAITSVGSVVVGTAGNVAISLLT